MYSAVALGATTSSRVLFVADRCWDVGGLGTLIFGIWLALNLDQYDFFDFWILFALLSGSSPRGSVRPSSGAWAATTRARWPRCTGSARSS